MPVAAVWLEIGFGAGEHLAAQAEHHPDIGFIGCEVFEAGIVRLLGEVVRRGLGNVRLFTDDARLLLAALPPASLGRLFVLFPDPWPKRRHHKRRLIAPATLDLLASVMKDRARFMARQPGFVSIVLHRSLDGKRIVNYVQWKSRELLQAAHRSPEFRKEWGQFERLAEDIDPHLYEVAHVEDAGRQP